MRRMFSVLGATAGLLTAAACPAQAGPAEGVVLVFEHEAVETTRYETPSGCYKLPLAAHVLVNLTTSTVRVHWVPLCLSPGTVVRPGFGSHVLPVVASFSV